MNSSTGTWQSTDYYHGNGESGYSTQWSNSGQTAKDNYDYTGSWGSDVGTDGTLTYNSTLANHVWGNSTQGGDAGNDWVITYTSSDSGSGSGGLELHDQRRVERDRGVQRQLRPDVELPRGLRQPVVDRRGILAPSVGYGWGGTGASGT